MFIGHYIAGPLGAATGHLKLWHAFIATQFVDFIWAALVLLGIEKGRIVEGFTKANPMDFHFMPYSHSLLFTALWAAVAALGFKALTRAKGWRSAGIIALLVMSHWVGDVIVHAPDMTWYPGSEKIGFGLWNYVWLSLSLELGLFFLAAWVYMRATQPRTVGSIKWAAAFAALIAGAQIYSTFGPLPGSLKEVAIAMVLTFILLAFCAARFERTRSFPVKV